MYHHSNAAASHYRSTSPVPSGGRSDFVTHPEFSMRHYSPERPASPLLSNRLQTTLAETQESPDASPEQPAGTAKYNDNLE